MTILHYPRIGYRDADAAYVLGADGHLYFREEAGGVIVNASVPAGTYSDLELASALKAAMDAAGAATYAVWRDGDTGLFHIQQAASPYSPGELTVYASGGDIRTTLGFIGVLTGALAYVSDLPTPDLMYLDLNPVRGPAWSPESDREDNRTLSGLRRSAQNGELVSKYEGDLYFHGYAEQTAFRPFLKWALRGGAFRWWPDKTELRRWVETQLGNKNEAFGEMLPALNHFTYRIKLEEVGDNGGTIDLEECQDR